MSMDSKQEFTLDNAGERWEGANAEVKSDPLIDSATGQVSILRIFEFAINPAVQHVPTKQELFEYHYPQITAALWKDGLVENREVAPRLTISEKKYRIYVTCTAKQGLTVLEKPLTLQELMPIQGNK
jgi:hypothetical protein